MLFGAEHVKRYQETDGREGYEWEKGTTTLLLYTKGRKTGQERVNALIFREWEGDYLVVASKGGNPDAPDWYVNLEANPDVEVQIKGDRFAAKARTASPSEKPSRWQAMVDVWPDYSEYQKKTDRNIPVVILHRS